MDEQPPEIISFVFDTNGRKRMSENDPGSIHFFPLGRRPGIGVSGPESAFGREKHTPALGRTNECCPFVRAIRLEYVGVLSFFVHVVDGIAVSTVEIHTYSYLQHHSVSFSAMRRAW